MRKGSMRLFVAALAFTLAACNVSIPASVEGAQSVSEVFADGTFATVLRCSSILDKTAVFRSFPSTKAEKYPQQPDINQYEWTVRNPVIRITIEEDQEKKWMAAILGSRVVYFLLNDTTAIEPCTIFDMDLLKIYNSKTGMEPKIVRRSLDGSGYEEVGKILVKRRTSGERR